MRFPLPLNQFGCEDRRLEGFAKTHCVGDQQPGARLAQALDSRIELIGNKVHDGPVAEPQPVVIGKASPHGALQEQQRGIEGIAAVCHQLGPGGVEYRNVILELGKKEGRPSLHKI
jgi:hypothetical protein